MGKHQAMLYEDYIKLRNAKIGDVVILSDGSEVKKTKLTCSESPVDVRSRASHNMNLDYYDHTYV